ncbi:MAG: DegV family protein [Anaerolineae bacterium]|nr:DegV family protein [Anaerolineae bacterium]
MAKVAVVTDTTACIPEEMMRGLPIIEIPLNVIFGEETLLDRKDISPENFYTRLEGSKVSPTTSQPSPAAFVDLYDQLLRDGHDILTLTISSKLSGTSDSAIQAEKTLGDQPIELIDSLSTSMAMGYSALLAARAASQGGTLQDCKIIAEKAIAHSGILLVVDTLEYLHRGGRIGGAAAFLGTALNLKPVLEVVDGRIEPVERVRTKSKAMDRLVELFMERVGNQRPIRVAVLHANAANEAEMVMKKLRTLFPVNDISEAIVSSVSPVIGTHTGPGTVGIAWVAGV